MCHPWKIVDKQRCFAAMAREQHSQFLLYSVRGMWPHHYAVVRSTVRIRSYVASRHRLWQQLMTQKPSSQQLYSEHA